MYVVRLCSTSHARHTKKSEFKSPDIQLVPGGTSLSRHEKVSDQGSSI